MALSRFPAYLTIIRQVEERPRARDTRPIILHESLRPSQRDPICGVATRQALHERLETIGALAPAAPLSFVVVKVEDLARMNRNHGPQRGDEVLQAVARVIRDYTRATDTVGRLSGASFGIVLQGTGQTGAGAAAARLSHYLGQLHVRGARVDTHVTVATGKGINADVLPVAAAEALDDCG